VVLRSVEGGIVVGDGWYCGRWRVVLGSVVLRSVEGGIVVHGGWYCGRYIMLLLNLQVYYKNHIVGNGQTELQPMHL